jgi:hypothetical protein
LSTIIGPRCPGPVSVVTNTWPGVGFVSVSTVSVGGFSEGSLRYVA